MQEQIFDTIKGVLFALFVAGFSFLTAGSATFTHHPNLIFLQQGDVTVSNPENSQAFYDELTGSSKNYFITSDKDFNFYLNLLVPEAKNRDGIYSANIFLIKDDGTEEKIANVNGLISEWNEYYDSFSREYYVKGPELEKQLSAGKYKIEIYSSDNLGRYVLAVGKTESYDAKSLLNIYWQVPTLKMKFFETPLWQFALTPFAIVGIGVIGLFFIMLAVLYYFIGVINLKIKQSRAKTILLSSSGMQMKSEIVKLLQKPAYDITVAFVITAAKVVDNIDHLKKNYIIMKDMGFNIQEVDIEGKSESEVRKLIEIKDIIYIEDGSPAFLLQAMKKCNFEKIIRKLLKDGKVYFGSGAGSVVAGRTIKTVAWTSKEKVKIIKGLNLVPFDIFCHYKPEDAEVIKKKMPWKWQRKKLKIITDEQAILVQSKNVMLLGNQEEIVI